MYEFKWLNEKLLLITWLQTPSSKVAFKFVADLKDLLDKAEMPFYIITDLRKGRIIDLRILSELGTLTQHEKFVGSTAFSENLISNMFATTFKKLGDVKDEKNLVFDRPEDAIAFLESLEAGLTTGIEWDSVIGAGV